MSVTTCPYHNSNSLLFNFQNLEFLPVCSSLYQPSSSASEACKALALTLVRGPDYLVYLCAAMVLHAEEKTGVLRAHALHGGPSSLEAGTMTGFGVGAYLEYMEELQGRFREAILAHLLR